MRKWIALVLLCGFASPAMVAKTLSVAQMEQLLTKLQGKPDGKVAKELADVQLTERVSLARLACWEVEFHGSRSRMALIKLADLAAFLNPPAADVSRDPSPDIETQKRILRMAVQNVRKLMSRLPDFYATQFTLHYENTLPHQFNGHWVGKGTTALHLSGVYKRPVAYRKGREVPFKGASNSSKEPAWELTGNGQFGPILAQVLGDALDSGLRFVRWNLESGRKTAVFSYAVPENASHFRVGMTIGDRLENVAPAYHGEIEIDPEAGEILRVTEVTDMTPSSQAKIEVEYAPVPIAFRSYILPVRSVAYSKIAVSAGIDQIDMNDVAFIRYHEFHSTARIVPDWSGQRTAPQPNSTDPASGTQW